LPTRKWFALLPLVFAGPAFAGDADAPIETVTVVGTSPVPGSYIDADKLPSTTRTLSSEDVSRSGTPNLTRALNDQLGSVSINDDLDDPFQPDILFRGFEASPVLGTPQGLAVYQNGVRINEAFGDTVNWDLFPDIAIDRVDVMSSNPVYGLNALGGAVVLTMKNGFTYQGGEAELSGFGAPVLQHPRLSPGPAHPRPVLYRRQQPPGRRIPDPGAGAGSRPQSGLHQPAEQHQRAGIRHAERRL
jgi:outer membrane cobalamin receptor